jgi:hypothetical protein
MVQPMRHTSPTTRRLRRREAGWNKRVVFIQKPPPRRRLPNGSRVTLVISKGSRT